MTTIVNIFKQFINFLIMFFKGTRIKVNFVWYDEEPYWTEDGNEVWYHYRREGVRYFNSWSEYWKWEQNWDMIYESAGYLEDHPEDGTVKETDVPWRRWWLAHRIGRIYIALRKLGINIPGFYSVMRWGLVDVRIDDIAYDYDNTEPYAIMHLITPKTVFVLAFAIFFSIAMIVTGIKQWLNNGDYWCPNASGTIMEHHVVTDGIDEVVDEDSYPLEVRITP